MSTTPGNQKRTWKVRKNWYLSSTGTAEAREERGCDLHVHRLASPNTHRGLDRRTTQGNKNKNKRASQHAASMRYSVVTLGAKLLLLFGDEGSARTKAATGSGSSTQVADRSGPTDSLGTSRDATLAGLLSRLIGVSNENDGDQLGGTNRFKHARGTLAASDTIVGQGDGLRALRGRRGHRRSRGKQVTLTLGCSGSGERTRPGRGGRMTGQDPQLLLLVGELVAKALEDGRVLSKSVRRSKLRADQTVTRANQAVDQRELAEASLPGVETRLDTLSTISMSTACVRQADLRQRECP